MGFGSKVLEREADKAAGPGNGFGERGMNETERCALGLGFGVGSHG